MKRQLQRKEINLILKVIKKYNINNKIIVVVIGDISVGKTNIIKRIMGDEFVPCQATIGVDFTYVENQVKDEEDPKKLNKISLQIWDTCK